VFLNKSAQSCWCEVVTEGCRMRSDTN